ncbi:MAG: AhpC/TSA family protein [Verrucomicrobia bacterium]|nr:AhpC/TSA family protein [Verrucomicrobiota bacterium]
MPLWNCNNSLAENAESIAASAKDAQPIQVGVPAPNAHLRNMKNEETSLREVIAGKPTVLIFYRGSWCPYCNAHLSGLLTIEGDLLRLGYQIVAISPDRVEELNQASDTDHLNYQLFSDEETEAMRGFGVAYRVDHMTMSALKRHNVDLEKSSGRTDHILPVPSVFILDRSGKVVFVHANADYKIRMKGSDVLSAAKASEEAGPP